ncbi:FAD-dependent oxidoreductase [Microbacterium sp. CFBP9034]|uniref:FAD-dependent oxidoreductase n=1 Tax=Microbacterium sp. CFBP9034 TaxID=3096540 RepID=UPI002A6A56BA|nr:FAD-dependent oxidoreductase [Microbacterium sp. CFBP9034]MDY0909452.1 FAD-dependent oxidoreductase [Microbacterium sp. CFBP9034]
MESLWRQTAPTIPDDDESPPRGTDVLIVGAGLTGLALASMLTDADVRVTVIEARSVGAVTTGNTTGKLSLLQGDVFSGIRSHAGDEVLRAYLEANRAGQAWLREQLEGVTGAFETKDAITYAVTADGARTVERERDALAAAGLEVETVHEASLASLGLPFDVSAALRLGDQQQLQPMIALGYLAARLRARGVRIVTGCRVTGAEVADRGVVVQTAEGPVRCGTLVLATGSPILDRGLFFAKLAPSRSFVGAYELPPDTRVPHGMFLSVDDPSRSLRVESSPVGTRVLVVGGGAHPPGRVNPTSSLLAELDDWTRTHWPSARRRTWWAAQDYRSVSRLPYAGRLPRGGGRILAATGYNKWGMTNGVAAALQLAGLVLERPVPWGEKLTAHRAGLSDVGEAVEVNAAVGGHLVADWVKVGVSALSDDDPPAEGAGHVRRRGMSPVAESTVGGATRRVSGVCTHLGGILTWNDAECTWDCPLHGSRFTPTGEVLEGPAVDALERHRDSRDG